MAENSIAEKLSSLSDMELYNMINAVCEAVGMDAKKSAALISDIPRLRRMISALSDKQLSNLISSLSTEQRKELFEKFTKG